MSQVYKIDPQSLGTDINWDGDLDPSFSMISGTRSMQMHVLRRLQTDRMRLIYNLDYGLNLEKYVNADVTREMLQAVQNDVRNELIKDERLTDVTVIVEWIPESSTVKIKTKCFTNEGSFTNIVIVNSLGVSFEAA
jgi:hypothetical protein